MDNNTPHDFIWGFYTRIFTSTSLFNKFPSPGKLSVVFFRSFFSFKVLIKFLN